MTRIEILKKAIEKATLHGYSHGYLSQVMDIKGAGLTKLMAHSFEIIFSHEFARALWGVEGVCDECGENAETNFDDGVCKNCCEGADWDDNPGDMVDLPAWKHHLKQMVLEENPIEYLEKFI